MQYDIMQYDIMQYDIMQYDIMQYDIMQCPPVHTWWGAWRHRARCIDLAQLQGHGAGWGDPQLLAVNCAADNLKHIRETRGAKATRFSGFDIKLVCTRNPSLRAKIKGPAMLW